MAADLKNPWYTGMKTKTILLLGMAIAVLILALAWYVCTMRYQNVRRDILADQSANMNSWVTGTVNAVEIWTENLEGQVKRISNSDLYRLFASEANLMDESTVGLLNDADNSGALPEEAQSLVEQIPLIRNVLLDFQNLSGFLDTRVVNQHGQTLLSSLARPAPLTAEQRSAVDAAFATRGMSYSPVRGSAAGLVMDAADPMLATMSAGGSDELVAAALVTTPVTGAIAQFLARDLRSTALGPHIIQRYGDQWQEIQIHAPTPVALSDGQTAALRPTEDGKLEFALRPGLGGDFDVYSVGAAVADVGWWIVLEIPASEVSQSLRGQGLMIYGIGFLVSLGVILGLALVWWALYGRQQRIIAERFERLYRLINQQKRLLDSVNLSLDVGLFMSDHNGNILIGNRAFADIANTSEENLEACTLSSLFEARAAGNLLENVRVVAISNIPKTMEISLDRTDGPHLYRINLYPFEDKVDADGCQDDTKGAVATMQDITEFRRNSEKRRMQQIHTIDAFIKAVEGVDPYLAGHSSKMSRLGNLLAKQMELGEADRNTVTLAANLSQVGKLFVPRDLLAKSGKLSADEHAEMARVPEHAYRVLKDIDFELPVPEAIYQMNEKLDGTGFPQHLQTDEISLHAKILAVLNAFTAMVSPRSYRDGMSPEQAVAQLREAPNTYDQQVVDALAEVTKTMDGIQAFADLA